jgi:hypothetical protein
MPIAIEEGIYVPFVPARLLILKHFQDGGTVQVVTVSGGQYLEADSCREDERT